MLKWSKFRIGDYFEVEYGKFHSKSELDNGNVNYITASGFNNGISGTIDKADHQGNCITVASDGVLMGASFYQEEPFSTSNIVSTLTPMKDTPLNKYNALFICSTIFNMRSKFGWLGYKMSVDRIRNMFITLPAEIVEDRLVPNWTYMEEYMRYIERISQDTLLQMV